MAIQEQEVKEFIKDNMTNFAMATIVDRAVPAIHDGLLPIHRRILYAMYRAGITSDKPVQKSGLAVGEAMKIHEHSDDSIYESLALLTDKNGRLHNAYIDGKGNFGAYYSDKAPSAKRYTSCRLSKFAEEVILDNLNKEVIDFTFEEGGIPQPLFLAPIVPNILLKYNKAIAVGFACNTAPYNLIEVCNLTSAYMFDTTINVSDYLLAPDFPSGAKLIYNKKDLEDIYNNGCGSVLLRSKYIYDKKNNIIDVYEIPFSTTQEKVIEEITARMDSIKEIVDVKNETGFDKVTKKDRMSIAITIKKNANPDEVMNKLYKRTSLQTTFSVNMTVLADYVPKQLGIKEILDIWISYRIDTLRKSLKLNIRNKESKLHLLKGLEKVLLDIDKAIEIIRNSSSEETIIDDLKNYFNIDEVQANHVATIKLKNINKAYILKQLQGIKDLEEEVTNLKILIKSDFKIKELIKTQLEEVSRKYGQPRKTEIIYNDTRAEEINKKDIMIEDYNCNVIITKEGYIKKTSRGSEFTNLKEGDVIMFDLNLNNKDTIYCITNKGRRIKIAITNLELKTPATLGEYIHELEKGEEIIEVFKETDKGYIINCYNNGKVSKIPVSSYLGAKKIMSNCINSNAELKLLKYVEEDVDLMFITETGKCVIINTSEIPSKEAKNSQGNVTIKLKTDDSLIGVTIVNEESNVEVESTKGIMHIKLSDKIDNNRSKFEYYKGSCGNIGKMIYKNKHAKTISIRVI